MLAVGGFGSALVSIPLLALLLPVKVVLPVVLIVDFIATFLTGLRLRRDIALDEVKPLIPFTLIGLIAGVTLLVNLPARWVLTALGIFILAYSLYSLIHHDHKHIHSRWWALPTGLSGGLFGGMFGMGGPIYVMHLSGRIPDAARLRATLSTVFTINTAARLALFFASGLLLQRESGWGVVPAPIHGSGSVRRPSCRRQTDAYSSRAVHQPLVIGDGSLHCIQGMVLIMSNLLAAYAVAR